MIPSLASIVDASSHLLLSIFGFSTRISNLRLAPSRAVNGLKVSRPMSSTKPTAMKIFPKLHLFQS